MLKGTRQAIIHRIQPVSIHGQVSLDVFWMDPEDPEPEIRHARVGNEAVPRDLAPKDKAIVLGLVTSKRPELESVDALRRRIDEAARYIDLDRLCLSPQCGFASSAYRNELTVADQIAKLELVVNTARQVWG